MILNLSVTYNIGKAVVCFRVLRYGTSCKILKTYTLNLKSKVFAADQYQLHFCLNCCSVAFSLKSVLSVFLLFEAVCLKCGEVSSCSKPGIAFKWFNLRYFKSVRMSKVILCQGVI